MVYKKIDLDKVIIYDLETLKNCFVGNFLDFKTGAKKTYTFFNDKKYEDQPFEFWKFLRSCVNNGYTFLGYNVLGFDGQILDEFYNSCCGNGQDPLYEFDTEYIIDSIYNKAQHIISLQNDDEKYKYMVSESKMFIPHIDLYKLMHYDRPAKATSLKWIQFSMCYPKIQEMPIAHDEDISIDDIEQVVDYCWNDVDSTLEFYKKVKYEVETRHDLSKEFNLDIVNASEPKMVREIFGKFLCEEMKVTRKELKELKTIRTKIPFKEIIFPYTKFQTPQFQKMLEYFKDTIVDATPNFKTEFKYSFVFQGMNVDLGLGGIHACIKNGVYTHKEDEVIEDADGKSFYPFLAISNGLRPKHLGSAYNKVYPMMYDMRMKYDKKDPKNYIFKIILNSAYGLSKEINSYLYDPQYTYQVTINGQLTLLMLVEALSISIPNIQFLQMNTDGVTYVYNKKYTDKVRKICEWWEKTTKIELEYAYYEKMVINDVNNYIAVKEGFTEKYLENPEDFVSLSKDYVKKKGLFETSMLFHKNPSALIIPKALERHFIIGEDITSFINNEDNSIFDYCLGVKKKSNFKLNLIQNFNFAELITEQQKVCRYIVANNDENSGLLVKDFNDGRRIMVHKDINVQPLDIIDTNYLQMGKYNVDKKHYLKQTNKIIEQITPSVVQQSLF